MIVAVWRGPSVALALLFVHRPEDLWIAYLCHRLARSIYPRSSKPLKMRRANITGDSDLLAGTALDVVVALFC